MAEVKWIKITTNMFEDEKIDFISSLPESDAIIVIWIRLMALAGKANAGGYLFLTEKIPYTEEMLAHKFKKPTSVIKLALETFRRLEMIEMDNNIIFLPNFEKHQNIEAMEKIREYERIRKAEQRAKKKLLELPESPGNVPDGPVDVTVLDIDLDIDKETEEEIKDIVPFSEIIDHLNQKAGTRYRSSTAATKKHINARWTSGYRLDDFKAVIDKKCAEWTGTEMEQYLTPDTLFGSKFEKYLNQKTVIKGGVSNAKHGRRDAGPTEEDRRMADKDAGYNAVSTEDYWLGLSKV